MKCIESPLSRGLILARLSFWELCSANSTDYEAAGCVISALPFLKRNRLTLTDSLSVATVALAKVATIAKRQIFFNQEAYHETI